MGEKQSEQLKLDNEMLTLDIVASDLLTLQALNAARLKEAGAVDATFVTKAINEQPLNLGQGIWLSDSAEGNLRSAIAVSRAANAFDVDGETAAMLVSVAMNDDQPIAVLKRLADLLLDNKADRLLKADAATLLALLTSDDAPTDDVLSAEFVVRNEHGLHARPGTMLVNTIKQFNSDITVTNLDGTGKPANGRSLMKVVALGVKKGHRLRFTAQGADAEQQQRIAAMRARSFQPAGRYRLCFAHAGQEQPDHNPADDKRRRGAEVHRGKAKPHGQRIGQRGTNHPCQGDLGT